MTDIFEEVDDALRQEKLQNIWNEYKNTIIASIIVLLLSAVGTSAYKSWDHAQNEAQTSGLLAAMDLQEPIPALEEFVQDTRPSHRALAYFSLARLYVEAGNNDAAAASYQAIIEDRRVDKIMRDKARILNAYLVPQDTIDTLKTILTNEKSPWIWHARLIAATIVADQGNYQDALTYLTPFDEDATIALSLKEKARMLSHVYTLDMKATKTEETKDTKD